MSRRRGKPASKLPVGTRIVLTVRCDRMHLWSIHGTVTADNSVDCGVISAPNAPDDPTCCPKCHEPFAACYGYHLASEEANA